MSDKHNLFRFNITQERSFPDGRTPIETGIELTDNPTREELQTAIGSYLEHEYKLSPTPRLNHLRYERRGNRLLIHEAAESAPVELECAVIEDDNSPDVFGAYQLMQRVFKPEDLDTFENTRELLLGRRYGVKTEAQTKLFVIKEGDRVVSALTGALYDLPVSQVGESNVNIFLGGYAVTDPSRRNFALGRHTYQQALEDMLATSLQSGKNLLGVAGECTWSSEGFWNSLGFRRIYLPDDGDPNQLNEVSYIHPPLDFDLVSGRQTADAHAGPEHLQVAFFDHLFEKNPGIRKYLQAIVHGFNIVSSYIPPSAFKGSKQDYAKHVASVEAYEHEFGRQFQGKKPVFLTRAERFAAPYRVRDFIVDPKEKEYLATSTESVWWDTM